MSSLREFAHIVFTDEAIEIVKKGGAENDS